MDDVITIDDVTPMTMLIYVIPFGDIILWYKDTFLKILNHDLTENIQMLIGLKLDWHQLCQN